MVTSVLTGVEVSESLLVLGSPGVKPGSAVAESLTTNSTVTAPRIAALVIEALVPGGLTYPAELVAETLTKLGPPAVRLGGLVVEMLVTPSNRTRAIVIRFGW